MKISSPRFKAFGAALLASFVVASLPAVEIKEDHFKALLDQDSGHIQKSLKDGTPDKKGIIQSKATALMIAQAAQDRIVGKDGAADAQMATLRDNAVKVAEAVAAKKYKDAAETAKLLNLKTPADKSAKTDPIEIHKKAKFDMIDLMSPLKKTASGGLNVENDIKDGSEKLKDVSKVPVLAARIIVLAELTEKMPTDTGSGKKSEANWKRYAKQMKDAATETYEISTVAKPDVKKVQAALGKINASCTECHSVFKTGG